MGRLGMSPEAFGETRLGHFFARLYEYNQAEENQNRIYLESVRMQTTALININLKTEDKIKPPQLWKLPWDEPETLQLTAEEITEQLNEFNNRIDDLNHV